MNRKEITKFLTNLLIRDRLSDRKYYATEVTLDYGTNHTTRIDLLEFVPRGVTCISDIEKGIFRTYEVKSCMADIYSGNGLNFFTEENFIVCPMEVYKAFTKERLEKDDYGRYKFDAFMFEHHPGAHTDIGFIVPIHYDDHSKSLQTMACEQFENPVPITKDNINDDCWRTYKILSPHRSQNRVRGMNELLFCMLRSGI